jgi:two-component system chemotaxis response regulator CheB
MKSKLSPLARPQVGLRYSGKFSHLYRKTCLSPYLSFSISRRDLAPQDFHMGIGMGPRIVLSDHAPENGLRPSVAYLFRSVAEHLGPAAVGILLTGMGKDGAEELKMMKQTGAITIAQNKESAVVHGMPGEAIKLGAVTHVLPPEGIADFLVALTKR